MDQRMMCGQGRRNKTGWHGYERQPEAPRFKTRASRTIYLDQTVCGACLGFLRLRLQVFLDDGGSLAVGVEGAS